MDSPAMQDPNAQDQTTAPVSTQDAAAAAAQTVAPQDTPAPPPDTPTPTSAPAPEPQGQDIAAPPQKPSLWKSLLTGALTGLMQGGVVGAVAGAVEHGQLDKNREQENEIADQKVDQAKLATHTAQANLALINHQISMLPPDRQTAFIEQEADRTDEFRKAGVYQPMSQPMEYADAMNQVAALTKQNPGQYFAAHPVKDNGTIKYQVEKDTDTPISKDITLPLPGGKSVTIPASSGVTGKQVGTFYTASLTKILDDMAKGDNKDNNQLTDISEGGQNKKVLVNKKTGEVVNTVGNSKVTGTPTNMDALQPDAFGFKPRLPVTGAAGYQKMMGSYKKNLDDLAKTEQAYGQFKNILDNSSGNTLTGAQSIVGLFDAIGISADPLAGKGFRINNLTVEHHANSTGLDQKLQRMFAKLNTGEAITRSQLADYAKIAEQVRDMKYVATFNAMHNEGLNADAALPTGNGQKADRATTHIFLHMAGNTGEKPTQQQLETIQQAMVKKGWNGGTI